MFSRRGFICSATAILAASALPSFAATAPEPERRGSNLDRLVRQIDPQLTLSHAHTGEKQTIRFFGPTGYDTAAVMALNNFWRDWRQNEAPQVDPRLFWGMAATSMAVRKEGHSGEVIFLSGFRSKKTNEMLRSRGIAAAENSFHIQARAVDFRFEGVPQERVGGFVEWLEVGGTGFYRRSNFTHMDTGDVRRWVS